MRLVVTVTDTFGVTSKYTKDPPILVMTNWRNLRKPVSGRSSGFSPERAPAAHQFLLSYLKSCVVFYFCCHCLKSCVFKSFSSCLSALFFVYLFVCSFVHLFVAVCCRVVACWHMTKLLSLNPESFTSYVNRSSFLISPCIRFFFIFKMEIIMTSMFWQLCHYPHCTFSHTISIALPHQYPPILSSWDHCLRCHSQKSNASPIPNNIFILCLDFTNGNIFFHLYGNRFVYVHSCSVIMNSEGKKRILFLVFHNT